jgi:mono/diheme cytochrome c family protein
MNRYSFMARALRWTVMGWLLLSCGEQAGPPPSSGATGGGSGADRRDASGIGRDVDARDGEGGTVGVADASTGGSGGGGNMDAERDPDQWSVDTGADHFGTIDVGDAGARDPFAPQPDTSEGLTNVSADLDALLERGALQGACAAWQSDPANRRRKLLCGKSMFFYEGFGTSGIPKPLITWLLTSFPNEVGPGFEKLGLIADPSSTEKLPLGLAPGKPYGAGNVETAAFTCASCHTARLPDGRYAVGAPNHAFRYGALNLMVSLLPALAAPGVDAGAHDAAALAVIQPLRDRMAQDPAIQLGLLGAVLPLLGSTIPTLSPENEHHYATWLSGTMDFFIQPLDFDDGVHTISKIPALWGIPDARELGAEGLSSIMISWTGGTATLLNFARSFVSLGGGDRTPWPDARFEPLLEYLTSLRAPASPAAPPAQSVQRGGALFASRGCLGCHDGPRGSGRKLYDYAEIGTDDALKRYTDPDLDGTPCCGIVFEPGDIVSHQLKSPRLNGLWAAQRFLHNGSLDSLEQLLCLEARPKTTDAAYGSQGHVYGCDAPEDERRAMIDYLRAH